MCLLRLLTTWLIIWTQTNTKSELVRYTLSHFTELHALKKKKEKKKKKLPVAELRRSL